MSFYQEFKDEIISLVGRVIYKYPLDDISRFAIVYDFGSIEFFPLYVAALTKKLELEYRDKISSDSDYQLLWNPEEFSEYATEDLIVNFSDSVVNFIGEAIQSQLDYELKIRTAICEACLALNVKLNGKVFVYAVDPELADLRKNLLIINNIPKDKAAELPSWA